MMPNNPLSNPLMANGGNPMQLLQQLRQNPVQFLRQAGLNVPADLSDPNAIIQHLMNSGQITQERYNQARQMVNRFKR